MRRLSDAEFERSLSSKHRKIQFTLHAIKRANQRLIPISVLERDLLEKKPILVIEQESDSLTERKFDVYYTQTENLFHRYILVMNDQMRVISVMRTNKNLQRLLRGEE